LNASNYFKEKILRKHKEDVAAIFSLKRKERVARKQITMSEK